MNPLAMRVIAYSNIVKDSRCVAARLEALLTLMGSPARIVALLCVLLIALHGSVQAFHVHSETSKLSDHECSICLLAHPGVLRCSPYYLDLVFVRRALSVPLKVTAQSSGFVSSLHIRPPPSR